jgi:uncharacterized integral membrane protein (TIGR00697 family)
VNGSEQAAGQGAPLSRSTLGLMALAGLLSGALAISAVLANKIIMIWGLTLPAGAVAYALTFPVTDLAGELWGRRQANWLVGFGFMTLVVVYGLIQLALALPAAPFYAHEQAFHQVVGGTARIIMASLAAYLISQFHDVWAFQFWKRLTGGRHLWLRNNLSTVSSQFLDSVVFCFLAFYGLLPVWPLVLGQFVIKLLVALADTPLVYLAVYLFRRSGVAPVNAEPASLGGPHRVPGG